jgi:hypothetical protein
MIMSQAFDPKRRTISAAAAWALLGFPLVSISGCGGGGGGPASPSNPAPNPTPTPSPPPSGGDVQGTISANHGHSVAITAAQLQAGNALSLTFGGSATHSHGVQLSAAEVTAIRDRQRVSKASSVNDAHDHTVTFN